MMVPSAVSAAEKDMGELSREFETNVVGTWRVTKHFLERKTTQKELS